MSLLLRRRMFLSQQETKPKNLFDINNPMYTYYSDTNKNPVYRPRITGNVIENGGVSGIMTGALFTIDTTGLSNITLSFNAEFNPETETRTVLDGRCANGFDTNNILIDSVSVFSDANGKILNGFNRYVINVTNYDYFAFGFISIHKYGMKITNLTVLNNVNLFNIGEVKGADGWTTSNPDGAGTPAYGRKLADGTLQPMIGNHGAGIIWTGAKIPIEKSGNYYCTCEIKIDSSIKTKATTPNWDLVNKTKNKPLSRLYLSRIDERDEWIPLTMPRLTIPNDWVGDDVYLSTQIIGDATQYTNLPVYLRNINVYYGDEPNVFDKSKVELTGAEWLTDNNIKLTKSGACIDMLVPAGTYTILFDKDFESGSMWLRDGKVDSGYIMQLTGDTTVAKTFTHTASKDGYLRLQIYNTGTISNIKLLKVE